MTWIDIAVPFVVSLVGAFAASFFSYRYYRPKLKADLQKEFESRFNEQKWQAYKQFADIIYEVLDKSSKKQMEHELPKLIQRLRKFMSDLWIVGSDDVVNAVSEWFVYSNQASQVKEGEEPNINGLIKLMDIIIAMRKDLGYSESKIGPMDLLKTFINDLDKYHVIKRKK